MLKGLKLNASRFWVSRKISGWRTRVIAAAIAIIFLVSLFVALTIVRNDIYQIGLRLISHQAFAAAPVVALGFNEGSGTTTADASGNNNAGTLVGGVTWTTAGKYGKALSFDGSSGVVRIPDSPSWKENGLTGYTVSMWVKVKNVSGDYKVALGKGAWPSDDIVIYKVGDHWEFGIRTTGMACGGSTTALPYLSTLDNTYHHIALSMNASAGQCQFFADGQSVHTDEFVSGTTVFATGAGLNNLYIGGLDGGQYLNADIDEVRVYKTALTQAEIQTDMNTPIGGAPPGDTTPPVISGVAAGSVTSTSATITWTTNEGSDSQVEYGLTTAYGQSTTLNPALVTAHSQGLSGLTAGTLYHYRVKSRDAAGNLATSGDFTFTTAQSGDTTPPVISNVAAGSITTTSATITWTTNENSDSQVEYGVTTAYGQSTTLNPALVTAHSQGISGLTAGTLYHYRVKSRDAAGNLAVSGDFSFTTLSLNMALIDPTNRIGSPGKDLLSRNCNWSLPLLSLPGRAGLDLGLTLSLNSLVYTRAGSVIHFDPDQGYPAPGFRLGFPEIRSAFTNTDAGAQSYLLSMSSGSRVEFRQIGVNVYEAVDSSYRLLTRDPVNSVFILHLPDGTQCRFVDVTGLGDYKCTQVKDRHGNYITIGYGSLAEIRTITDTLGRVINFNYDGFNHLNSITQNWGGQTHAWATFAYGTQTIQTNFPGLTLNGTTNGAQESVLLRVGLADGSVYSFEYNTYAQVKTIRRYAPNNSNPVNFPGDYFQRAYTTYGLPDNGANPQTDCPRATSRTDWAYDWNPGVTSVYAADPGHAWGQVTFPDGTIYKEFFATTGWQRGLTTQTETWSGGVRKKWTTLQWTQDNTGVAYRLNPRVTETNVHDEAGNRRRTTMSYTSFGLPSDVYEYDANATTVLRRKHTDYNLSAVYTNRRIIGLPSAQYLYDGNNTLFSKVTYEYDLGGGWQVHQGPPLQHDTANYGPGFVQGRGNLNVVRRWDVTDPDNGSKSAAPGTGYNTSGSVIFKRDTLGHQSNISYTDSFSATVPVNTLAYPTTVTDPANFSSTVQYNYDFGAVTRTQNPKGAAVTRSYDAAGRIERITNMVNSAYTRYVYEPNQSYVQSFTTINDLTPANEFHSSTFFDGHDRVRATTSNHPTSVGQHKVQFNVYDVMGRVAQQSNPMEINGSWQPTGDDTGLEWTTQAYDWQGRPTVSTNQDGTTKSISYEGCGCAGGQKVILVDEMGRRREQNFDILGRMWRERTYNLGGSDETGIYSTTTSTYNIRDQVTNINVMDNASGMSQNTVATFDGHGRLQTRKYPFESAATSFVYNADDTLQTMTDARGVTTTHGYNNRDLVTSITYGTATGVLPLTPVTFGYDEMGNRLWMEDGPGRVDYHYNMLSQMDWEERSFDDLTGAHRLAYEYNLAGQLKKVTDPWGSSFSYVFNKAGEITDVIGSGYINTRFEPLGPITQIATGIRYRAWGELKSFTNGSWATDKSNFNYSYNSRLQLTHFDGGGRVTNHTFYNDGRVRDVIDSTYNNFNRTYSYDHIGRLIGASAGTVAPKPYDFTYSYDVWNNTISRSGTLWTCSPIGLQFTASYTNNRNIEMEYDAAGNVTRPRLAPLGTRMQYDAASRQANVRNYIASASAWFNLTKGYDGDGRLVRTNRQQDSQSFYYRDHFIRSSMLDGAVIAEIGSSASVLPSKRYTYIYLHGERIAYESLGEVVWVYLNPVIRSRWESNRVIFQGQPWDRPHKEIVVDPTGGEVGITDPCEVEPLPPEPDRTKFQRFGYLPDFKGGCVVDLIDTPCDLAFKMLNSGGAVRAPENLIRYNHNPDIKQFEFFRAFANGYQGWLTMNGIPNDSGSWGDRTLNIEGILEPTPQQIDPRVAFRDYAEPLSYLSNMTDCEKLVRLAYLAGNLWKDQGARAVVRGMLNGLTEYSSAAGFSRASLPSSDPNFRVGVFRSNPSDPHFGGGFNDTGFKPGYRDNYPTSSAVGWNQVRHFTFWLAAGFEMPPFAREALYSIEETRDSKDPDVGLGETAITMGTNLTFTHKGRFNPRAFAEDIWKNVCGESKPVPIP